MTSLDGLYHDAVAELQVKGFVPTEAGRVRIERWLADPVRTSLLEPIWFMVEGRADIDGMHLLATGECMRRCDLNLRPEHLVRR